jgi:ubiquinone/menaquinone biosynthesis C-methylase UbiE
MYPVVAGIPNFLKDDVLVKGDPNYRWIKMLEFLSPVYLSRLWTFFTLTMAGAKHSSFQSTASFISETLAGVTGTVLEVACGPATYSRRIASTVRNVYGIDFCMSPLQQGMKKITREGISGIKLARANVSDLPFVDDVFDGGICSAALHLFPDTALALREIARTMKAGATLAMTTFVTGNAPLTQMMERDKDLHLYQIPELQHLMVEAGFKEFEPNLDGNWLKFSTHKEPR